MDTHGLGISCFSFEGIAEQLLALSVRFVWKRDISSCVDPCYLHIFFQIG